MRRKVHHDLERLIGAARYHGDESEADMEVGDLQEVLRHLWARIPASVRRDFMSSEFVIEYLKDWQPPKDWEPPSI